jgi:hypothetical protein
MLPLTDINHRPVVVMDDASPVCDRSCQLCPPGVGHNSPIEADRPKPGETVTIDTRSFARQEQIQKLIALREVLTSETERVPLKDIYSGIVAALIQLLESSK